MSKTPDSTSFLAKALADGYATLLGEGKQQKITYHAVNHTERFSDPEEQVRAEFWAELIYRYEYKPQLIGFEVTVPRRTPADKADLVVYRDEECKEPYLVIECKKADISDSAFEQALEQACGNRASLSAPYTGVVAGVTRRFLDFTKTKPQERKKNKISDLPVRYGKPPEWRFYNHVERLGLSAVSREDLRAAIRKCHQTLWEGGKRNAIDAFGEFCKIVFVKIRDEMDCGPNLPYRFQLKTGEEDEELAKRIRDLYAEERDREPDVFTDKIDVDAPILRQVVEHLEAINLSETDLDTKGVAFEEFMGGFFKGDFGQYFTPRDLIAFCVQMLAPERNQRVLDPACGSGGFLLYALDYLRNEAEHLYPNHAQDMKQHAQCYRYWHDFAQNNLFGVEINDKLARVAKMNMIIHDDGHTNVVGHDALDLFKRPKGDDGKWSGEDRPYLYDCHRELRAGKFDLILTNPPFGSVVKQTEKGEDYLNQFELRKYLSKNASNEDENEKPERDAKGGAKAAKKRASVKTEILFLERVHTFLKPGTGKAAIVVPDGILTNSSLQGVRDWLMEHFQILAVVSLPQFAFAHYDAGVKASIIFLRRLAAGETVKDKEPIFMALAENIGYDATGRKTFAVEVEKESAGWERIEIQRCDLFDYRVTYEWNTANAKKPGWYERCREILRDTGMVAQYRAFQEDPRSFFV